MRNHRLGRSAGGRLRSRNVEAIFEHIEIERAQVHHTEVIHSVIDLMKGKVLIPVGDIRCHAPGLLKHVLIKPLQLVKWHRIILRIEIMHVPKDVAEGISDFAVAFGHSLHQLL